MLEINKKQFQHIFIVHQNFRQSLLFGMDFAQKYRIGINWYHGGVSYLRYKGRKLIWAWPNGSISDSGHKTKEILHIIDTNVDLVTNDLGIRLKTSTVVIIPPHNIANHTIRTTAQSFTM